MFPLFDLWRTVPKFSLLQEGLTQDELDELDKIYREVYLAKYPVVGITEKYAKMKEENLSDHDEF